MYAVYGCFGYLLNGLGAVLLPLQHELGVSRGEVAFYPTLFAGGLLGMGIFGGRLVSAVGRTAAMRGGLIAVVCGALLLTVPQRAVSLAGAVVFGAAGAVLVQLLPAVLSVKHPRDATAVVGEANALASMASALGPLAVAAGLLIGIGWRPGYLLPLAALVLTFALLRPLPAGPLPPATAAGRHAGHGTFLRRWLLVLLAVSVEFCMVFWAASAITSWDGAGSGSAAAEASMFLLGMAAGRGAAGPIVRTLARTRRVLVAGSAVALAGFALFWGVHHAVAAAAGLLITGCGVALLYPAAVASAIAARPDAPDWAAARCALASGLAIGGAPLLLAQLSQGTGLRVAYLIVPVLLVALIGYVCAPAARLDEVVA